MIKKALIRLNVSFLFITLLIPALSYSQQVENVKSIKEITTDIKETKDAKQRHSLFEKLGKIKPKTAEDVEDIAGVIRSSRDDNEKEYGFEILKNIGKDNKHLEKVFLKLLNDPERDVRTAAIVNLGKYKTKEAAPRLREIVKGYSKIDHLKFKTMRAVNPKKAYRIIFEPGAAAMALGDMKDEEAIPILVERFDVLEGYAAIGLSKIGKKALPAILELARKETDPFRKDSPAQKALADIEDKEAKPDLISILKTEKNPDIRERVLISLMRHMFDDEVLDTIKGLYEKEKDILFLHKMQNKKALPFLIDVLKKDSNRDAREVAVVMLEKIWDPSAIPALEDALKDDYRNVRERTIHALITLGDTETLSRLRDYLKINLGNVVDNEYDKSRMIIIDKRLSSGKRGAMSFDEFNEITGR